jgi:hypothetical protein
MAEKLIEEMNKNELAAYAKKELGVVELDLHRPVAELRQEVAALDAKKKATGSAVDIVKKIGKKSIKFLRHPENGRVFPVTEFLLARKDMIPCSEDGTTIVVDEKV